MKVLVVGSGGREHAIVYKLRQSPAVSEILCAPGNGGISDIARCFDVKATDIEGQCRLALEQKVDFVVVAPDDPLALGLVDRLTALGIPAFGPTAAAARIESSKSFAKNLMRKHGIPTADYAVFSDIDAALQYVRAKGAPIVVKCDGLALGKGVVVCHTTEEAEEAVKMMMSDGVFGKSGSTVVIEEYMTGPEVTVLCFTDGKTLVPMPSSQDHKRAYDGDEGPNTGGMGSISPSPFYTPDIEKRCLEEIFIPTIRAMEREGCPFKGVLYFGLMLTPDGPKVVEYNARFGDPEAQAVLVRLESDLFEIMTAVVEGTLDNINVKWNQNASCCVVLASGGYPAGYKTGYRISGLDKSSSIIFHAGTKKTEDGDYVTAGGRVLGVTALGKDLSDAVNAAYEAVRPVGFENMHYRRDIGKIKRTGGNQ
ncbi:MAG: phosphoribosylamine--glycine ligase [Clostridiales bacterium]|nr:phosphoribosylamine--glycine ligase [Clostridiales bacterium]